MTVAKKLLPCRLPLIRSTPWPKLTFRTVMLSPMTALLQAMTVPSNAWPFDPFVAESIPAVLCPSRASSARSGAGRSARRRHTVDVDYFRTTELIDHAAMGQLPDKPELLAGKRRCN